MTSSAPKKGADEGRDDGASGSAIPGAWARPASAFADEATVVRPDRAGAQGSRLASLAVLGVLAIGTAAFAWGVTVALQTLDAGEPAEGSPELATSGDGKGDAVAAANRSSTETASKQASKQASKGSPVAEAAAAAAPPVPDADPTFPALPDQRDDDEPASADETKADEPTAVSADESAAERDDDIPAPKALRLARAEAGDDDAPAKKKRYKRGARKGQKLPAKSKRQRAKPTDPPPLSDDQKPAAAAAPPPPPAPTAASLTRESEQLLSQGKLVEARTVVERALQLSRGYPRAHRTLAVICAKQGDTACARKGYETYLKLAPNAPDAPDVRRILGM